MQHSQKINSSANKARKSRLNLSSFLNSSVKLNEVGIYKSFFLLPLLYLFIYPLNLVLRIDLNIIPLIYLLYHAFAFLFFIEKDKVGLKQTYIFLFTHILLGVNTLYFDTIWLEWVLIHPLRIVAIFSFFLFIFSRREVKSNKLRAMQRLSQLALLFLVLLNTFMGIYFFFLNFQLNSLHLTRLLLVLTSFLFILDMNSDLKQEDWLSSKTKKILPSLFLSFLLAAILDWILYIWQLEGDKTFYTYLSTFVFYLLINLSFICLMLPAYLSKFFMSNDFYERNYTKKTKIPEQTSLANIRDEEVANSTFSRKENIRQENFLEKSTDTSNYQMSETEINQYLRQAANNLYTQEEDIFSYSKNINSDFSAFSSSNLNNYQEDTDKDFTTIQDKWLQPYTDEEDYSATRSTNLVNPYLRDVASTLSTPETVNKDVLSSKSQEGGEQELSTNLVRPYKQLDKPSEEKNIASSKIEFNKIKRV